MTNGTLSLANCNCGLRLDKHILAETKRRNSNDALATINKFHLEKAAYRNLIIRWQLALGIRRNFTNCAAVDMGVELLGQISRQNVQRAEIRVAQYLLDSSRGFHMAAFTRLGQNAPIAIYCARSDATNSAIWQKR